MRIPNCSKRAQIWKDVAEEVSLPWQEVVMAIRDRNDDDDEVLGWACKYQSGKNAELERREKGFLNGYKTSHYND